MSTITQKGRAVVAMLALGLALVGIFAGAALAGSRVPAGYTAADWRADQLRSVGLNQRYHLGTYRTVGTAAPQAYLRALMIRSDALNRKYHLGRYAIARAARAVTQQSSGFDWGDAGIGAAATAGLVLVAIGVGAGARRYRAVRRVSAVS